MAPLCDGNPQAMLFSVPMATPQLVTHSLHPPISSPCAELQLSFSSVRHFLRKEGTGPLHPLTSAPEKWVPGALGLHSPEPWHGHMCAQMHTHTHTHTHHPSCLEDFGGPRLLPLAFSPQAPPGHTAESWNFGEEPTASGGQQGWDKVGEAGPKETPPSSD